jgi:hypothetical protein
MERIHHIPVPSWSVVFWQNWIPHANVYQHKRSHASSSGYCLFLPYVAVNCSYIQIQLENWKQGKQPKEHYSRIHNDMANNNSRGTIQTCSYTPSGHDWWLWRNKSNSYAAQSPSPPDSRLVNNVGTILCLVLPSATMPILHDGIQVDSNQLGVK